MHANQPDDDSRYADRETVETRTVGSDRSGEPRAERIGSELRKERVFSSIFGTPIRPVKLARFALLEFIGAGGMGEVYAAYDGRLDRKVAIKLVRSGQDTPANADDRLLREARTLARVSHPNVVQVFEADVHEGRVFLAMEFIHGVPLGNWLESTASLPRRARQRSILRQFIAAGRGLEAAHGAGLVHRDFKPDNVLVGEDDRPRVVDFGLARDMVPEDDGTTIEFTDDSGWDRLGSTHPVFASPELHGLEAGLPLTARGHVLGTPRYMAPEQMRGGSTDHRSDQFSFCQALYEALYRQKAFESTSFSQLALAKEHGEYREHPPRSGVSSSVHRALMRGMSPAPADRFASMTELLAVLDDGPRRRRRWLVAMVATLVIATGASVYALSAMPSDPCAGLGHELDAVWTPARKAALETAFAATGVPYARATWRRFARRIDDYTDDLEGETVAACRATLVDHKQSGELYDKRLVCLDRGRRRVVALVESLATVDAGEVERAVAASSSLPELDPCSDAKSLLYGVEPPEPVEAEQVNAVRRHLAAARTHALFGRFDDALREAREQLATTANMAYRPVHAEALAETGRILGERGAAGDVEEGERMLRQASLAAESERHDELAAEIWNDLVYSAVRHHSNTARGHEWSERAQAATQRVGETSLRRARVLHQRGLLYFKDNRFGEAETHLRQALNLVESGPGALPFNRALLLHDLAKALRRQSQYERARELYEQAIAVLVGEVGDQHPQLAEIRFDLATIDIEHGEFDLAREVLENLLSTHREVRSDDHPRTGVVHLELAEVLRRQGELDRAYEHADAGRRIFEAAYHERHSQRAVAYTRLGAIAFLRGEFDAALSWYERVHALQVATLGADHFDVGYTLWNIAEVHLNLQRHDDALDALHACERIFASHYSSQPDLEAFVSSLRGQILLAKGRLGAARAALETAVERFHDAPGTPKERADACWALARVLDRLGRAARASELAGQALAIYRAQGDATRALATEVAAWLRDRNTD